MKYIIAAGVRGDRWNTVKKKWEKFISTREVIYDKQESEISQDAMAMMFYLPKEVHPYTIVKFEDAAIRRI